MHEDIFIIIKLMKQKSWILRLNYNERETKYQWCLSVLFEWFQAVKECYKNIENVVCKIKCDSRLEKCGHVCEKKCHVNDDPDHEMVSINKFYLKLATHSDLAWTKKKLCLSNRYLTSPDSPLS